MTQDTELRNAEQISDTSRDHGEDLSHDYAYRAYRSQKKALINDNKLSPGLDLGNLFDKTVTQLGKPFGGIMANKRPDKPRWALRASKYGAISALTPVENLRILRNPVRKSAPDRDPCRPAPTDRQGNTSDSD